MLKKKWVYVSTLILGIILIGVSFLLDGEALKPLAGVCIGVGAGLIGMSFSNLIMKHLEQKRPQIARQNEIEFKDERNTLIRYRAKAKAADIVQWFIMGIAYLLILINAPLWLTLATVLVFALYHFIGFYFIGKYQKEM
ncbi:MAG: hypothetical protein K6T85_18180 [Gorillibacterium sp.]|nr:hypothetical protein [Gorillibacterium sp.]